MRSVLVQVGIEVIVLSILFLSIYAFYISYDRRSNEEICMEQHNTKMYVVMQDSLFCQVKKGHLHKAKI
jgi:hypothetical protein